MTQFSLFGAEAAEPSLDDLDGLLLAGGHWVRSAAGSRASIVVADRWRADAIDAAFAERGVAAEQEAVVTAESGFAVRTAFTAALDAHAARWTRGANRGVPAGLVLSAVGLRLWTVAAGRPDDIGYRLETAADDTAHRVAGAQLSRLGVTAASLTHRGAPAWRVTSARRLRRLVELVGPAPAGGSADWPGSRAPV